MKRLLLLLIPVFFTQTLKAQDFYELGMVQTIEITFAESNWDQLLDAQAAGNEDYILAESVSLNGVVFDSVGVKYKGNSTYNPNQTKNPFHIELDTYKEQEYQGYTDIKLSNVAKDPSFIREVLSYQILRKYMDGPLSNYANVFVNGTLIGLYSNSESISKRFVDDRFGSKKNTFVKCNPPAGAGPQSNDFPNLVYLGGDSTDYYDAYELKSDAGWQELIDLCDTLANHTDEIESILNVDAALWMLAYNNVLVNLDSYIGAFAQNYYLYRDDFGRFIPVVWDLNESFGRFSMTGSGNLNGTTAKQQMNYLLNLNDPDFPLVRELLNIPGYKRRYLAHFKTILLENFDNNDYYIQAEIFRNLIDGDVQADNNKFFTYQNFRDNLDSDVGGGGGPGGGATPGIANLMDGRNDYLLGQADFTATQPTIAVANTAPANPIINEPFAFTTEIADASQAYLYFRTESGAPFEQIELFDDGNHDDGAANDGVFGNTFTMSTSFIQYYIYAENDQAGKFAPARAAHEYYFLTATFSNPTVGDLVINEFMAANESTQADQDGEFDDWIELYNNSNSDIDLSNYALSDDATDLVQWTFPEGTMIGANDYLIVWADSDEEQTGLHANFKLSAAAEAIFLLDDNGNVIDEVSYVEQSDDVSFGRFANGTGGFQLMTPTFNAENIGTSRTNELVNIPELSASPNPADGYFHLAIAGEQLHELAIYNIQGQLMHEAQNFKQGTVDISTWPAGVYIVQVSGATLKLVVQ